MAMACKPATPTPITSTLAGGTVPAAVMNISGSAQIGTAGSSVSPLIVNELVVSGAAGAYQLASGSTPDAVASTSNWITDPVLTVAAEDDTGRGLNPAEVADLGEDGTAFGRLQAWTVGDQAITSQAEGE